MIPQGVEVFVALEPIDLRLGFERLAGLVRERLGHEPRSGALFLFFGKRKDALKLLFADPSGMCLFYKRLDRGTFRIPEVPSPEATHVEVDEATLDALLDGIDLESKPPRPPRSPRPRTTH